MGLAHTRNLPIFEDLLCLDWRRGPHSTGVAFTGTGKNYTYLKNTVLPWRLIGTKKYADLKKDMPIMMGHNRLATVGNVTSKNAHPFVHGNIILTHNGTLDDVTDLEDAKNFDTDSEAICHSIATIGIDATYKKLKGAWTLVWYDMEKETLNFVSNGKRPMFMQADKRNRSLFWSSDKSLLEMIPYEYNVPMEDTIWSLTDHMLVSYNFKNNGKISKVARKLDYPLPQLPYSTGYHGGVNGGSVIYPPRQTVMGPAGRGRNLAHLADHINKNRDKTKRMVDLDRVQGNAFKLCATLKEYEEAFNDESCSICGDTMKGHWVKAEIIDGDVALCGDCAVHAFKSHFHNLPGGH